MVDPNPAAKIWSQPRMTRRADYVRDTIAAIRAVDLDRLEARLLAAIERDDGPTTVVDGYPTSTLGIARGGGELTSVEAAADTRVFGRTERDQLRQHLVYAIDFVGEAQRSLAAVGGRLTLIDELATPTPAYETAGTGYCNACHDYCVGTGEDRLRSGYCPACRMAWSRAGFPERAAFERSRPKVTKPKAVPNQKPSIHHRAVPIC